MKLLPGWEERIRQASERSEVAHFLDLPKNPEILTGEPHRVTSRADMEIISDLVRQRPVSFVGFDFEYKFGRPPVMIRGQERYDISSIQPLLLSLAFAEEMPGGQPRLLSCVIDLTTDEDILPLIAEILSLPIPFVGHAIKRDLFCLEQLGLPISREVWDTFIFEKAIQLGSNHWKYRAPRTGDLVERISTKEDLRQEEEFSLSLVATCRRHSIPLSLEVQKSDLQRSFLDHPEGKSFSEEQLHYAAEDAQAVAQLYLRQTAGALQQGILSHLVTVEMPWVRTHAEIEWAGFRVDSQKAEKIPSPHRSPIGPQKAALFGIKRFE